MYENFSANWSTTHQRTTVVATVLEGVATIVVVTAAVVSMYKYTSWCKPSPKILCKYFAIYLCENENTLNFNVFDFASWVVVYLKIPDKKKPSLWFFSL